jgi:[citrate (pro-3S)-lyase] ligase
METELPKAGIQCTVIPRIQQNGAAISASTVRRAIKENQMELLPSLVPPSTLRYLLSEEAVPVLSRIRQAEDVVHY